jgi:hypothetical protein
VSGVDFFEILWYNIYEEYLIKRGMFMATVTCKYCGKKFNREKESYI